MPTIDRRKWLQGVTAATAALTSPAFSAPQQSPRRLLFNWDGSMIHCFGRAALGNPDGPLTKEQFISLVFEPLAEQSVDTVLFSFGNGNIAEYESRVLEWPGEADRFQFPESNCMKSTIDWGCIRHSDPASVVENQAPIHH